MHYLVLDIETVRDERTWQPPAPPTPSTVSAAAWPPGADHRSDPVVTVAGLVTPPAGDPFPPPYGWRPIVIGCVLFERDGNSDRLSVKRVGAIESALSDPDEREEQLLRLFAQFVGNYNPTVITWNGRRFDLPVLLLRSLRYGINHAWFYGNREARYRYSEDGHCDLMDQMAECGASDRLHLDGMAKLIGLPGKFGDINGAGVGEAFAAGRLAEIADYCVTDAVQTAFLWLRWLVLKGFVPIESYQATAGALLERASISVRTAGFLERIDRRVLLLQHAAKAEAA